MSKIIKYKKDGKDYSVQEHLKGKRSEYSLCWQDCKKFKPHDTRNCTIAEELFVFTMLKGVRTAVWECTSYEKKTKE